MQPLYFAFIYIAIGYLSLSFLWLYMAKMSDRLMRSFRATETIIIQSSLNLLHVISAFLFPISLAPEIPMRAVGLTMFTLGAYISVYARIVMGKQWSTPGEVDKISTKMLVTTGPFGLSRNPIYVGIILMAFGMAIALGSIFVFLNFILFIHFYRQVMIEEKSLRENFGDEYVAYHKKIPRFI
jgi:protein-S-isoprenylcysteine O-methyltransferase Ste14